MFLPLMKTFPRTMVSTFSQVFTQFSFPIILSSRNPNHLYENHLFADSVSNITTPTLEAISIQPTQIIRPKLPAIPFSEDTLKFLQKFEFQFSDVMDEEHLQLCKVLAKYQHCYANHRNDVGQIKTPKGLR